MSPRSLRGKLWPHDVVTSPSPSTSAPATPGSSPDESKQYLTTFVVNDVLAIDAGCLGLYGEPDDQARIEHVFLTHSHADHVGTLPIFIENVFAGRDHPVAVHGHADTIACPRL